MPQAFELDDLASWRERKPRGGFLLVVDDFREQDFRASDKAAASHLFGVTHQFIEVNLGRGDEGADSAPALDDAFAFKGGERVAGGHQAHVVYFCQFTLRGNAIARTQGAILNGLANGSLNPLVGRDSIATFYRHSVFLDNCPTNREPWQKRYCQRVMRQRSILALEHDRVLCPVSTASHSNNALYHNSRDR